jgi:hypothetical protein
MKIKNISKSQIIWFGLPRNRWLCMEFCQSKHKTWHSITSYKSWNGKTILISAGSQQEHMRLLYLMSHHACCHTCYTIQLMHYSHFKTQSLQYLKPIQCWKRVCKYKTPTCFGLFSRPPSGAQSTAEDPLKMVVKKDRNM